MIPLDKTGKPLAWRCPGQPSWWVDAWNGIYDSTGVLLAEIPHWVATEDERILAYGEDIVPEDEVLRRQAAGVIAG